MTVLHSIANTCIYPGYGCAECC